MFFEKKAATATSPERVQTKLLPGQYETIKELLVQPMVEDIIASFAIYPQISGNRDSAYWASTSHQTRCEVGLWALFNGGRCVAPVSTATGAVSQLTRLWVGEETLATTYGPATPSLALIRVTILQAAIDALNQQFPDRLNKHPAIDSFLHLDGMERIRALFQQYIVNTQSGSLERYKLALEVLLEKEKLGLPSYLASSENIVKTSGYAPGDFSHCNFSDLDLKRKASGDGNFKGLIVKHSNCDKTDWDGICLNGASFERGSLRGADLSKVACRDLLVLLGTDIDGAYFGVNSPPDRRAINFATVSQSEEKLVCFRAEANAHETHTGGAASP